MNKHSNNWLFKAVNMAMLLTLVSGSLCLTSLAVLSLAAPAAHAQSQSKQRTRLARPGYVRSSEEESTMYEGDNKIFPATAPNDGRPFTLGVEHKQTALTSSVEQAPPLNSSALLNDASLKSQSGVFDKPVTTMFALQDSRSALKGNLSKDSKNIPTLSVQLLSNFDLELIVDSSLSMRRLDCPNFLSRWEWCGEQTKELSRALVPFVPKGLTLTSFASEFDVYPNSNPARINDLFENPAFMRGTKLAEPLEDRFSNFFSKRKPGSKPMLIAVITDGVPSPKYEPMMVVQTLVNATKRMKSANEVTVVFFQIGGADEKGRRFLSELDYNLVKYGARFDIVRTVSFEHLQQVGLSQALVQAVQDFAKQNQTK
ncbi:hypothetical protein BH11CYA1_BH11CYA1_36420 [soil metagenome]